MCQYDRLIDFLNYYKAVVKVAIIQDLFITYQLPT